MDKRTLAVEVELGLEDSEHRQVCLINNKPASQVAIDLARKINCLVDFPTIIPELDACQLEITTNGYHTEK